MNTISKQHFLIHIETFLSYCTMYTEKQENGMLIVSYVTESWNTHLVVHNCQILWYVNLKKNLIKYTII